MKISELSTKVDELISVAKDAKNSAGVPATAPAEQPDDPEVQRLADRIEDAIRVLKGDTSSGNTTSTPTPTPAPSDINPATGLPPPPNPVSDPNAPAV